MKTGNFLIAAITMVLLAGCATTLPPKKVNLSQTCYGRMAAVPAESLAPLSVEATKKLKARDYADLAKCLEGSDGNKVPVVLYKVDGVQSPLVIKVMLTASSSYGVFAARATLLDQNFNEVSRTGFDKFINRGNTYTADVFVNSTEVRYVAVGPDDQQVGKSEKQYSSQSNSAVIPAGPVIFVYTSGKDSVQELAYRDVGSLLVTVQSAVNAPIEIRK